MTIRFMDGTVETASGNTWSDADGVLVVQTAGSYGELRDTRHFPLVNIKSYEWKVS
jgi:hypothetical protein